MPEYLAALRGVAALQEKAQAGMRMAAIQFPNGQIGFWTVVLVEGRVVPYPHWAGEMGELEAKLRSLFPEADWGRIEEEVQALQVLWTG